MAVVERTTSSAALSTERRFIVVTVCSQASRLFGPDLSQDLHIIRLESALRQATNRPMRGHRDRDLPQTSRFTVKSRQISPKLPAAFPILSKKVVHCCFSATTRNANAKPIPAFRTQEKRFSF